MALVELERFLHYFAKATKRQLQEHPISICCVLGDFDSRFDLKVGLRLHLHLFAFRSCSSISIRRESSRSVCYGLRVGRALSTGLVGCATGLTEVGGSCVLWLTDQRCLLFFGLRFRLHPLAGSAQVSCILRARRFVEQFSKAEIRPTNKRARLFLPTRMQNDIWVHSVSSCA